MTTPIGPILDVTLRTLDCGCVCDDADAIWSPCRQIADTHAEAVAAVRAGVVAAAVQLTTMRVELPIDNAALVRILADVQELEVAVRAAGLAEAVRA